MENQIVLETPYVEKKYLLSTNQFILLSVLTFGAYHLWWTYKAWKVFRARENYSIHPALRTVFSIIFLYGLFRRIEQFASRNGYEKSYSSGGMFIGIFIIGSLSYLPDPYYLLSTFTFLCYLPAFEALNFAMETSNDYDIEFQHGFNGRQTFLIVIGSMLWLLTIIGLLFV